MNSKHQLISKLLVLNWTIFEVSPVLFSRSLSSLLFLCLHALLRPSPLFMYVSILIFLFRLKLIASDFQFTLENYAFQFQFLCQKLKFLFSTVKVKSYYNSKFYGTELKYQFFDIKIGIEKRNFQA